MTSGFLQKLRAGETVLGTMVMWVRTPGIVRMAAAAGFDYIVLDQQHSNLGLETLADMCEMGRAAGIAVLIRPCGTGGDELNRLQDLGADGFMFHDVTSRAHLDRLTRPMTYPPAGGRGIAIGGPGADYIPGVSAASLGAADSRQCTVIQIESQSGLDNLDDLARDSPVDVIDVGRQDLSIALGIPGQTSHPLVSGAVDRVVEVCRANGLAASLVIASLAEARAEMERGVRVLTYRNDKALLLDSFQQFTRGARAELQGSERKSVPRGPSMPSYHRSER